MSYFNEWGFSIPAMEPAVKAAFSHRRYNPDCWLAAHGRWEDGAMPSCSGRLVKAHLIPQQVLLRELASEVSAPLVWDERVWVWACGGVTGIGGHHGAFDQARRLGVPRSAVPREL